MPACARAVTANWTSDLSDKSRDCGARYRHSRRSHQKQKQFSAWGPLSEISIADRGAPPIWKRIHIQKPSGLRTKFFIFGWGGEALCIKSAPSAIMATAACGRRNSSVGIRCFGGRDTLNDIHDLLKTKTALLHSQLESLPLFEALQRHNLPKVSIVSFLRCLAIIHAILERRLSRISQHQVSLLHDATLPKLPLCPQLIVKRAIMPSPKNLSK
jgi:hypothetical protein